MKVLQLFGPLAGGILFALGLNFSGMANPENVKGFLDVTGEWKEALIFVLCSAVLTNIVIFHFFAKRMKKPFFDIHFFLPSNSVVTPKLIVGSIIFGIGWGISGLCPGPAAVNLVSLSPKAIIFFISMLMGMFICQRVESRAS